MSWKNYRTKLRKPQIGAVELIEKYLKTSNSDSSLIHMPTGSGKSGIIAIISNLMFKDCILVVTPRVSITKQLHDDIKERFFSQDLNEKPNPNNRKFQLCNDSLKLDPKKSYADYVFVSTVQKIDWIRSNNDPLFKILINKVKMIIFDEGHYEPAFSWSQTIRSFKGKKILFTATPFRNDLKPFDISKDYIYPYSYHQAVTDGYLRKVNFIIENSNFTDKIFVEKCLSHYKREFGGFTKDSPKMIIRCQNRSTIRRIVNYLHDFHKNIDVIGIHETFISEKISNLVKVVPDKIKSHSAKIWVHQNKLLEGIDDSQFKMLAIYDEFENDRSLIQQIGRIVRVDKSSTGDSFVIDFTNGMHEKIWNQYLSFDKQLDIKSFLPITSRVVDKLSEIGNEIEYLFSGFKEKLNIGIALDSDDLQLPQQINLLDVEKNFTIEKLVEFTTERLAKDDRYFIFQEFKIDGVEAKIFFYYTIGPTPYLRDHYSIVIGNELIVFFIYKDLLCYYESSGFVPLNEKDSRTKGPISPSMLKRIFNKQQDYTINSVSLKNSNIGTNSIRTHGYSARSIDNTVSYLDDSSNIVSTLTGNYKKTKKGKIERDFSNNEENITTIVARYVGIENGRVSQRGDWLQLPEFVQWVKEIVDVCSTSKYTPKDTFKRYSRTVTKITKPNPRNILLDFSEIEDDFKCAQTITENGDTILKNSVLSVQDLCSDVQEEIIGTKTNYFFDLQIEGSIKRKIKLEYNSKKGNYKIDSDELDTLYEPNKDSQFKTINEFLNKRQSFKIIPEQKNIIYAYGSFYEGIYSFSSSFKESDLPLFNSIISIPQLDNVTSEKGNSTSANNGISWDPLSIFGLIDTLGLGTRLKQYFGKPDFVVCVDMGTEIADFICCYDSDKNNQKVVFIHAKISDNKKYSASSIQVVCGQATKNIRFLNPYNLIDPPNLKSWDSPWQSDGLSVNNRIRLARGLKGAVAWNRIKAVIENPGSYNEVWLMLGKTLSRSRIITELQKSTYEAIQAMLLLQSTHQSIGTVNSKLKVFCSP